jgi:hypothetical protein
MIIMLAAGSLYKFRLYPYATVQTGAVTVSAGSTVQARWSLPISSSTDWVGLFPVAAPDSGERAAWRYTSGMGTGTLDLVVPETIPNGTYELRLFARNGTTATASSSPITVTFPVASALRPPPPSPVPAELSYLVPRAQAAVATGSTTWARAEAVRHLVREAVSAGDCTILSNAYWSVGRIVGLPLRIVASSANGENQYDTHTTVEVWLPELSRWVISDPTFDGYWSEGTTGEPLGAFDIRDAVRAGTDGDIYWHSTFGANAIGPAAYYVNPLQLYANVWIQVNVAGVAVWTTDEDGPALGTSDFQVLDGVDLRYLPTDASVRVARAAMPHEYDFGRPPRYAKSELIRLTTGLSHDGSITLELGSAGAVVVTVAGDETWKLTAGRTTYDLTPNFGIEISPIIYSDGRIVLLPDQRRGGVFDVVVYRADEFPITNQLTEPSFAPSW